MCFIYLFSFLQFIENTEKPLTFLTGFSALRVAMASASLAAMRIRILPMNQHG
jgi:hypothetical protein